MHNAFYDTPSPWPAYPVPIGWMVQPRRDVMSVVSAEGTLPEEEDVAALVAAARRHDHVAFAELVRRYKSRVFGLAVRFARDTHELEDLCQEIFIQAYRKLDAFRGDAPFEHWLVRIAMRKSYDLLRRTRHERQANISLEATHDFIEDGATRRDSQTREARETIQHAMSMLSPDERLVLTLLELEDQPVREIAAATGWSEANVRTRACRARVALKQVLQRQPRDHR